MLDLLNTQYTELTIVILSTNLMLVKNWGPLRNLDGGTHLRVEPRSWQ